MPAASTVAPGKWSDLQVLFDNGTYSVVAGLYEGKSALGERWNGKDGTLGFPNQAGHPVWHVVPRFLAVPLLHGLLDELARTQTTGVADYQGAIFRELSERL